MIRDVIILSLTMLVTGLAASQTALRASDPGKAPSYAVKLEISPAGEPMPALKYRLLPELREMKSGNAALQYQRAHSPEYFAALQQQPDYDKYHDWLTLPLDKFPADKARALMPANILKEVEDGARRLHCDWEMLERMRRDGFGVLLPDIQVCRTYASLLALRARLEISEKKYAAATYTLQTGYALGRHVAEGPTLINGLVGLAITAVMNKQLETLMQQPDAPNLYWSLTSLPRPFIDIQINLEGERVFGDALFPGVRDILSGRERRPLPAAQVDKSLDSLAQAIGGAGEVRLFAAIYAAKIYREARVHFLRNGFTEQQLKSFPVSQVSLMYAVAEYDRYMDEMLKLARLPYWQAARGFGDLENKLKAGRASDRLSPGLMAQLLMPAVRSATLAYARTDRQFAVLRCIEAIRLHAIHSGKLPASLDEIKQVPIPIDPITGNAFEYELQDETAHFMAAPPEGQQTHAGNAIHYEILLRRK